VNGHLKIAKWLSTILTLDDIRSNSNYAFYLACQNGHLIIAQWLSTFLTLDDMRSNNNAALRCAYEHGHSEVVKWLGTFLAPPPRFLFSSNDDTQIFWQ
jgi:hypothetical protein